MANLPGLPHTAIEFALTAVFASASIRSFTHAGLPDANRARLVYEFATAAERAHDLVMERERRYQP